MILFGYISRLWHKIMNLLLISQLDAGDLNESSYVKKCVNFNIGKKYLNKIITE